MSVHVWIYKKAIAAQGATLVEPYDAWREYAEYYDEWHGPPVAPELRPLGPVPEGFPFAGMEVEGIAPPNKPVRRGGLGRTDQYADAPIDVPRLVKTAHAHLTLAIQGCQSDSKLDEVADRRVLQEALWGLESLISIWSLDSGK